MKKLILMASLMITILSIPLFVSGDKVPIDGRWDGSGLRSSIPAPPEVFIDRNIVSIYFTDELSDLTIYIMEGSNTVYQTVISSNGSDYTCDLPWVGQPGDYQILMVHGRYGYQGGSFSIE